MTSPLQPVYGEYFTLAVSQTDTVLMSGSYPFFDTVLGNQNPVLMGIDCSISVDVTSLLSFGAGWGADFDDGVPLVGQNQESEEGGIYVSQWRGEVAVNNAFLWKLQSVVPADMAIQFWGRLMYGARVLFL